jgi:hypothetical protein
VPVYDTGLVGKVQGGDTSLRAGTALAGAGFSDGDIVTLVRALECGRQMMRRCLVATAKPWLPQMPPEGVCQSGATSIGH